MRLKPSRPQQTWPMPHSAHLWGCSSHTGLPVHPWVCQAPPTWGPGSYWLFSGPHSPGLRPQPPGWVSVHTTSQSPSAPVPFPTAHTPVWNHTANCLLLWGLYHLTRAQTLFSCSARIPSTQNNAGRTRGFLSSICELNEYQGKDISICKQLPWAKRHAQIRLLSPHGSGSCLSTSRRRELGLEEKGWSAWDHTAGKWSD